MSELKKKSDESLKEYKYRLCENKDIYDLKWQEIADLINGESGDELSSSVYRKWWYAFKDGLEFAKVQPIQSDALDELEKKKIELYSERNKLQVIRNQYSKLIREQSRSELILELVKEHTEKIELPKFEIITNQKSNHKSGIVALADIHFGKVFKSINNEYSIEIAKNRMELLMSEIVGIVNREQLTHIDIINGADSIEGMTLRVSQLKSLEHGFIEQTIRFSKFMASWLNEISRYVNITYHHVPSSNHSEIRPFNSSRGEFPNEDLEKVIMHYIHDVLEHNKRIDVPVYSTDIVKINRQGFNIWAIHGHQLKNVKSAIKDLSFLHKEFIDYLYVAHFHHGATLTVGENFTNNVEVINIPSIMGSDEYADQLMVGGKAGANFSVYEENKGRTISYQIHLN